MGDAVIITDWLTDWLTMGWMTVRPTDRPTDRLTDGRTDGLWGQVAHRGNDEVIIARKPFNTIGVEQTPTASSPIFKLRFIASFAKIISKRLPQAAPQFTNPFLSFQFLFQELLLAEEWAKKNNMKFPPIDAEEQYKKYGMKEFYVFRHPTDPSCPIVMHFVLVNKTFREQCAPGIHSNTLDIFFKVDDRLKKEATCTFWLKPVQLSVIYISPVSA